MSQMDSQYPLPRTPQRTPAQEQYPSGSQSSPSMGMSPASRYEYNLKVLRRRDPSIISIFDQFSHVCIYHHDGQHWSKHGYEGSMFLFERNTYPPYGFYILNRVGMDDYISGVYPEDEIFVSNNILILRSYPDFLARRLAKIEASTSGQTPDKFSEIYAIPNIEDLGPNDKGRSFNIGLWMQPTDSRESMLNVMKRLHSYIKQNMPYPQEFRFGPGKPPPPHRLRAVPRSEAKDPDLSDSQSHQSYTPQSDSENDQGHESTHSTSSGDLSDVDKLFAKLGSYPQPSAPAATVNIDTLFASAIDKKSVEESAPTSPSTATGTGISLLDSIFASAGPHRNATSNGSTSQSSPVSSSLKPQGSLSTIYSPQPSSSATPPRVLDRDVISGLLLGYPPTRTTSAASTTYSLGAVSHPSSREGDNEDDSGSDVSPRESSQSRHLDNGLSEAGIVFDVDLASSADHQRPSGSAAARIAGADLLSTLGFSTSGRQDSRGRINGDVTPRAPLTRPGGSHRLQPTAIEATSSVSTVRGNSEPFVAPSSVSSTVSAPPEAVRKPRPNRTLVPFAPDSELWPYTRGPVQENSHSDPDSDGDDGDIVELNFEETSVLSDPEAFKKALQRKKSGLKGVELSVNNHRYVNGTSSNSFPEKEKGKKTKKSKKERDAIARREIEESWDIPPPSPADSFASRPFNMVPVGPPASPSPCASPELANTSLGVASTSSHEMMRTPTMTAKATLGNAGKYLNGTSAADDPPEVVAKFIPPGNKGSVSVPVTPAVTAPAPSAQAYTQAKAKGASNGVSPMKRTQNGYVDAECVRESIITAIEAQPKPVGRMEKSEFVREVLALIHTDKAFVERLWQQYTARLA
ncbi:hypothetical protein BYT27DRAFT_7217468 [Phlegmacium glaucopus]|nr:hypothetical protein BYT27DRAFT_7217468 [Phlegmacium glaucopus]